MSGFEQLALTATQLVFSTVLSFVFPSLLLIFSYLCVTVSFFLICHFSSYFLLGWARVEFVLLVGWFIGWLGPPRGYLVDGLPRAASLHSGPAQEELGKKRKI